MSKHFGSMEVPAARGVAAGARSEQLLARARQSVAGGESSTMRVLDYHLPLVIDRAAGAHIWDVDGNELIDMNMGYGPLIFGHRPPFLIDAIERELHHRGTILGFAHELSYRTAELVKKSFPSVDLLRFTSTGTEAGQTAVRLARAFTGRPRIILFEGHYHGSSEAVFHRYHAPIDRLQAQAAFTPIPGTLGMSQSIENALVVPWNDAEALAGVLDRNRGAVAAVMMEPIMGNAGVIPPADGFLQAARDLAHREGALLIFDEVITGFRVARGGAQERCKIAADITMFSKALGGGVPIGAIGGRKEVMNFLVDGTVFHGGVYSGNPLSLAAALATQEHYEANGDAIYASLEASTQRLAEGLTDLFARAGVPAVVSYVGAMLSCWLLDDCNGGAPVNYRDAASRTLHDRYVRLQHAAQRSGVYFHPNRYEPWYISTAHTPEIIDRLLDRLQDAIAACEWDN